MVTLKIGLLAGIDIEAMYYSFPIAAKNTLAEQARLHIEAEPAIAYCQQCAQEFSLESLFAACPSCQQYQYTIIQGKTMKIQSMEGR